MAKFAKGTQVRQIVVPIEGTVDGFNVDQETGDVQVKVKWIDAGGDECTRYFKENDLEVAE